MTVLDRMHRSRRSGRRITDGPTGYAGVDGDEEWAAEVRRLADLRGATLLAHNYQLPAIQDVADHVGDSLALSRIAAEAPEDTIVFCGVHFMAETAKILQPGQDRADPRPAGRLLAGRLDHRRRTARLEGRTPRRGRRLLRQHHRRGEGADRHLLHVVQRGRGGRLHHPRTARCCSARTSSSARTCAGSPAARTCTSGPANATCTPASTATSSPTRPARIPTPNCIVHPECGCATSALYLAGEGAFPEDRVKILSTGGMLDAARETHARQVLVATEVGMLHQLRRAAPEVDFRAVNDRASCKYMKMITPAALLRCLVEGADEVDVDPEIAAAGRAPACSG